MVVCLLTCILAMNYLVDPYLIHQWDTKLIQRTSPAIQKLLPWGKTYAAYHYKPEVVFLGSSRVEISLPTDTEVFKGKRVFNLGISGASLGDAINMLRHTSVIHRPEVVVWGLEYGWQFRLQQGNVDFDENLVAQGSWYPVKRFLMDLQRSISTKMTIASLKILTGTSEQQCRSVLATFGYKSDLCLEYLMENEGGTSKAFDEIVNEGDSFNSPDTYGHVLQVMNDVIGEYCEKGVAFRFFLHPVHALAELSFWDKNWEDQEQWKRDLVTMFDRKRQQGCDIRFMDFSGYNFVTTEDIPQATGKDSMRYYWEYSHYSSQAGRMILDRLMNGLPHEIPDDFGAELTGETIEQHLTTFRKKRAEYCMNHPQETKNMRVCNDLHQN